MKKFLAFIAVFFTVIIIGYLQPVFFPAEKPKVVSEYEGRNVSHTALPYEEIETTGYAKYIGEKATDFVKTFGEPVEKIKTNFDYELWLFGNKDKDYVELNVRENKILAIKAFNDTKETTPFYKGMELSDVSQFSTIFSNFIFTYENQQYDIELMEEDMNYRPLIAFDNGTFAILFFNQGDNQLSAVVYLDKETLLTIMPYQLLEGEALATIPNLNESMAGFDAVQSNQIIRVVNLLRDRENMSLYNTSTKNQKNAQTIFDLLNNKPTEFLNDDRLMLWYQIEEQGKVSPIFTLSNDEFQALLSAAKLPAKKITGIYTKPVYDTSFTVLSWFSDSLYYSRFDHQKKETISVAFSKESVLVLLEETEKEISQTEESE